MKFENPGAENLPDEIAELSLAEFPHVSYDNWLREAGRTLQGRSSENAEFALDKNRLQVKPLYTNDDFKPVKGRSISRALPSLFEKDENSKANPAAWGIAQSLQYSTPEIFNRAILSDLKTGQTAVVLNLDKATRLGLDADKAHLDQVGIGGVSISSLKDIKTALNGVDIEQTPIFIDAGTAAMPLAAFLMALARTEKIDVGSIRGGVGCDPLGELVSNGNLTASLDNLYDEMHALTAWANLNRCQLFTITADGSLFADAGAGAVEELAFAIATGIEYIREIVSRGLPIDSILPHLRFILSVDSVFFMQIAKLRAFRMLWAKIMAVCDARPESQKVFLHCRTSGCNVTAYDPYSNILRATTAALSAVIGGCDSLHVGHFDQVTGPPDDFSRRLARNIQLLLRDESYLGRVIDAAGGSWYLESLTDQIAAKAWSLFQDIETRGGMYKALVEGFPQELAERTAQSRISDFIRRKEILIGTNLYPDPHEKKIVSKKIDPAKIFAERKRQLQSQKASRDGGTVAEILNKLSKSAGHLTTEGFDLAIDAAVQGATISEILQACRINVNAAPEVHSIKTMRLAERFEVIRSAVEDHIGTTGSNLQAYIVRFADSPDDKAKADFVTGLFQIAGIEVTRGGFSESPEKAIESADKMSVNIVAICADIKNGTASAFEKIKHLKTPLPDAVFVLADDPGENAQAWRQAGIDEFAYPGIDLRETLLRILKKLGIKV